jgi:hypothetical protein
MIGYGRWVLAFTLSIILFCGSLAEAQPPSPGLLGATGLKDVFLGKENTNAEAYGVIGRLGILRIKPDRLEKVRFSQTFKSGDQFRFEITSNRNGWLYILHASPAGKVKQIWPQGAANHEVRTGQAYFVPPSPRFFFFDKEVGQEWFYVAIRSDQTPPQLGDLKKAEKPTAVQKVEKKDLMPPSKTASMEIRNFRIKDPFGGTGRVVVYDPGAEDADPYLYFSAVPEDARTSAMIEFQLRHQE